MPDKSSLLINDRDELLNSSKALIKDISQLIEEARGFVAREYNSTQVLLCWLIGRRIDDDVLKYKRAEYGESIIDNISKDLSIRYGRGYGRINLFRMLKFSRNFPDRKIVSTLSKQLSWSHFVLLCGIEDELKRKFYSEMCRVQNWSVRGFKKNLESMLYERSVISKHPENIVKEHITKMQEQDVMTTELIFKDPYFINFIGEKDFRTEEELENLILNNITDFLQELGSDFCFISRQKRMSTGKKDRYLDLLFFSRRLRKLIAIDLKIGDFDPAYKGQMEWYLNWLDKNERLPNEEKPVGIILCAGKDQDDIEYLEMDKTGIHVAQYLTELPPKEILEHRLKLAISMARENQLKNQILRLSSDEE